MFLEVIKVVFWYVEVLILFDWSCCWFVVLDSEFFCELIEEVLNVVVI